MPQCSPGRCVRAHDVGQCASVGPFEKRRKVRNRITFAMRPEISEAQFASRIGICSALGCMRRQQVPAQRNYEYMIAVC